MLESLSIIATVPTGDGEVPDSPLVHDLQAVQASASVLELLIPGCLCPPALPPGCRGRRHSSCLGGAGGRVAPWQERGVRQLPGSPAISSVANCLHSFAFPSGLPVSCAPHVVSIKVRVGEGKHVNYCSIYSH